MAEIRKYVCDVKGCANQLGEMDGSNVRLDIMKKPERDKVYPASLHADLCGQHLGEMTDWIEGRGLKLELDV